jgi:hypothetical protein
MGGLREEREKLGAGHTTRALGSKREIKNTLNHC